MLSLRKNSFSPDVIAFGNVLLDMSVEIKNTEILEQYGLTLDTQGEITTQTLNAIVRQVSSSLNVVKNPGGSALNTSRILRKLDEVDVLFFGAVGKDDSAELLKDILKKADLNTCFEVIDAYPTGQCICFVLDDKAGLYANIGASHQFSKDFLKSVWENSDFLKYGEEIQIFYIEGFFISGEFEVCDYIVQNFLSENRVLSVNLSAPYIINENTQQMKYFVENAFLVFGNRKEFLTLTSALEFQDLEDLVESLMLRGKKILVITDGPTNVKLFSNIDTEEIKCEDIPVEEVPKGDIVDTTGAGDAFVAGFLTAFLKKNSLHHCVVRGCDIAARVITQVGCNLP